MVLELDFLATNRKMWVWKRDSWAYSEEYSNLKRFRCEKISISNLEMQAREAPGAKVEIRHKVTLINPDRNHDKKVTLLFEVVNADQVDASFKLDSVKVEEGTSVTKILEAKLPMAVLKTEPRTKLRITMTNWDY
jgi:hypothetical protein